MTLWAALLLAAPAAAHLPGGTVVDLSYPFDESTVYWPTEKGFQFEKGHDGTTADGYYYATNRFAAAEHGGTHMDAPIHFAKGKRTVDAVPVEQLMGAAVVVDVSRQCGADRDYQVLPADFLEWERVNGRIPDRAIVLLRTGFGRLYPGREGYLGTAERGPEAVRGLHFPGLHPHGARWLLEERRPKALGIDTASIDHGPSTRFETHVTLFEANVPVFENLANLDKLPARGLTVIALPMKIKGGSGGPLRAVAIVPSSPRRR